MRSKVDSSHTTAPSTLIATPTVSSSQRTNVIRCGGNSGLASGARDSELTDSRGLAPWDLGPRAKTRATDAADAVPAFDVRTIAPATSAALTGSHPPSAPRSTTGARGGESPGCDAGDQPCGRRPTSA